MKRCLMLFLAVLVLMLSACGNGKDTPSSGETETELSEAPSPTATPTPDFSGTDFSGRWYVSELIDSNGLPVSDAEKQTLGAGFALELLSSGTYFVYDQDGKVLGQGTYSVTLNQLTLAAQDAQTIYEIVDADTIRITQPDTSVTVMKREIDENADGDFISEGETGDTTDTTDTTEGGEVQGDPAEDTSSTPEETAPAESPVAETTTPDATNTPIAE